METDISNPSLTFVHRLFHPFDAFPMNLWKNKIPRSPFIKVTSKENKFWFSFVATLFIIMPAILLCLTVRADVFIYHKLVTVDAVRNSDQVQVNQLDHGLFVVPLRNITVILERGSSVHYFRNVSSDDFCLSETIELALQCFNNSFPDTIHGVLFLFEKYNPLLKYDPKNESITDNNVHKLRFENPSVLGEISTNANHLALFTLFIVSSIFAAVVLIGLFKLKGENVMEKFCGIYSFFGAELRNIEQYHSNVISFNKRVIHQESKPPCFCCGGLNSQRDCLFKKDDHSNIQANEKECETLLKMVASSMKEGEELLSYEVLSPDFSLRIQDPSGLTILFDILLGLTCGIIMGIILFFGMILFKFLSTVCLIFISFGASYTLMIRIRDSVTKAHYILTNRQFIALEESNCKKMYCIDLENISKIWTRSVPCKIGTVTSNRQELLVELGNGGEEYNRGVVAINISDPQYYIDTIQQLRQCQV